jgi:quercetin dioxygenase-like cupin family protein
MRIVGVEEATELSGRVPDEPGRLVAHWLDGPNDADRLSVGIVTMSPGGATPPHTHIGGQVMVVIAGRGFVETDGERLSIGQGDIVICAPGELHTHGAEDDGPFSHLTVTTGGYTFPAQAPL